MTGPHFARFDQLDGLTLYNLLWLRVDVFVVEQECPYPELDGRDVEPGTVHVWVTDGVGAPSAYLRVLSDNDGRARIGRVCVAQSARGTGAAREIMLAALEVVGDRPSTLDAQSYLIGFYQRFGYQPAGPEYVEDGIAHVPMDRPAMAAR